MTFSFEAASAAPVASGCPATVHETVCASAAVTVIPNVTAGEASVLCVGTPYLGGCTQSPGGSCTFYVRQQLCVQIPLTFSAAVSAVPKGIGCGTPGTGSCPSASGCTHTIGYYKNHSAVTESLIKQAGGAIVLGRKGIGASYTVTPLNAGAVLSLNTPIPPVPASPPLRGQYRQLYAQLLAANLNLLSGAACVNALTAINNANAFLETSQPGVGKAGAPKAAELLAFFNEGMLAGCPAHCE